MRKILSILFLLLIVITLVSCSDQNKSVTIDSVDILAQIDTVGTIHVKELYNYTISGSNQGTTRLMKSNIENFQAYKAPHLAENADLETEGLEPLKVEKENNRYQVTFPTEDENKQVFYSYQISDVVTKYNDMADLSYSFFELNQLELHDVAINLQTPSKQISKDTFLFFHSRQQPEIQTADGSIQYQYNSISDSESYPFRLIFPAAELADRPVDQAKDIKDSVLVSEGSLQWRYQNIDENFNDSIGLIAVLMILVLLIGSALFFFHPNRKRLPFDNKALLSLLERSNPLFVRYLNNEAKLSEEDIIAVFFSLNQRNLISISEVPSEVNAGTTFRFTWKRSQVKLRESDQYIKEWLFTRKDELGPYFLLESMAAPDQKIQSRTEKNNYSKVFKQCFERWRELIEEQPSFQNVKNTYIPYHLFSFSLVLLTISLLSYFVFSDVWSRETQYVVTIIFTIFGSVVVYFKCHKILMILLFVESFILSLFLSMTAATGIFLIFIVLAGTVTVLIPSSRWKHGSNELRRAIKLAKKLIKKNQYPLGVTPKVIERQMQYAIILRQENKFVQQCNAIPATLLASGNYPLLNNPKFTVAAFDPSILLTAPQIEIDRDEKGESVREA
ncbi:DUF2207 domain-containing protein [Aquibacillus halophilus]|uniref:DUF2207 domain-containing protein n=1 Tax=Aquibacillus halophilus TaxID=930132 RepID=UPI001478B767|nr:DUF2207 domain-containing protein [Aquibacillus halophilus]